MQVLYIFELTHLVGTGGSYFFFSFCSPLSFPAPPPDPDCWFPIETLKWEVLLTKMWGAVLNHSYT